MKSLDRRTLALVVLVIAVALLGPRLSGDDAADLATDAGSGAVTDAGSEPVVADGEASQSDSVAADTDAADEPTLPNDPFSDLDTVVLSDLPPEAVETIWLIEWGGPYPFDRDDTVFQNREGILPDRTRGHYHEYTVITPGSPDRGARRIVAGEDGERYYTADHYDSFVEVVASGGTS